MTGTTTTRPPAARSLQEICEAARQVLCGQCSAWPGTPCAHGAVGTSAYHVSRLAWARRLGLITEPDFGTVVQAAEVFTAATLIFDAADCRHLHSVAGPGCPWCIADPYPHAYGTCGCGLCLCWRGADGRDNLCGPCRAGRHGDAR